LSHSTLYRLTDETIRKNWELYGHPDGRQEVAVGIALPKWIVEGKNNIWVLGFYGLIFGGALPALVGKWWFGSRQKTKDGVHARTAATFFKSLREDSEMTDVVGTLGKAFQYEDIVSPKSAQQSELEDLETKIQDTLPSQWTEISKLVGSSPSNKTAIVLLYAHVLRIPVKSSSLQKGMSLSINHDLNSEYIYRTVFDPPTHAVPP
jgi:translocation protein SEC63